MSRLPFWEHVEELRKVLIRSGWALLLTTLLVFCFHAKLLSLLLQPLGIKELYLLSPLEGFSTAIKLSFWGGVLLSSPIWLYSLMRFLLPAMRSQEKRFLIPFLALSILFIGGGVLFAYKITVPLVISFFQKFNSSLGENLWSLSQTVDFILGLLLAHGIVFELYVGLLFFIHFQLLTYRQLRKARRAVIVAIFVLSAILTPPDILSQILLATPMVLFYESAVFYAKLKRKPVKNMY